MPLATNSSTGEVSYDPHLVGYHADPVPSRRRTRSAWYRVLSTLSKEQSQQLEIELDVLRKRFNLDNVNVTTY